VASYGDYFAHAHRVLVPGGLFLNHGITHRAGTRRSSEMEFLSRHVFPGGELSDLGTIVTGLDRAGFEVVDVEDLGPHYARTTRQWVERLQEQEARARALVGERTYRTFLAYLAAASVAFEEGGLGLHQVLGARRGRARAITTREPLYAPLTSARAASRETPAPRRARVP
jgi:cyclopropane-fatty-acyl-phospholipid synthase